ncbi:MAG: hypothetical protein IKP20_03180 [Candidatus Methanomethylophilaceae archaeon]|jgi:uncharacterized protein Yka (UPF0111/DUF47 family)|nr:hypothetical protein [Candidatus Methanomethylophilaceae archaeon]
MGLIDKVGDTLKDAGNKIKDGVSSVDDKIDDKIDAAKIESQIKGQEKELDGLASEIGKKVIDGIGEDGSFDISSIQDLIEKVKEIKSTIAGFKSQLDAFKK